MRLPNIHGSHLGPYTYPLAIDYINRNLIDVEPIITHVIPLDNFEDGFQKMFTSFTDAFGLRHEAKDSIKVLLTP